MNLPHPENRKRQPKNHATAISIHLTPFEPHLPKAVDDAQNHLPLSGTRASEQEERERIDRLFE